MEISQYTWQIIEEAVLQMSYGTVTLIVQDGKLLQLDKMEKIRLLGSEPVQQTSAKAGDITILKQNLRKRVSEALQRLRYGQVIIVVKEHKILQIERLEKLRFDGVSGFLGDGI